MKKPQKYRDFIDCMVDNCKNGQGQIDSRKAISGVWNENANDKKSRDDLELMDQYKINLFLKRLSKDDRKILAEMLANSFRGGVFETLKYLGEFEIEPFIGGYEGSPYDDFIGRVAEDDPWNWPAE